MMMKRVEFLLNLEDPGDAAIYRALRPLLRYRRAGALIRQALQAYLVAPAEHAVSTPSQVTEGRSDHG
jgi:hypothetical protein